MVMMNKGLNKLMEECGELTQIAAKKSAFMHTDLHPDGNPMQRRLEDEIADVQAASEMVIRNLDLDRVYIAIRAAKKLKGFETWHAEPEQH